MKGKLVKQETNDNQSDFEELISALEGLGYKTADIKKILPNVDVTTSLEGQVKEALRLLLK